MAYEQVVSVSQYAAKDQVPVANGEGGFEWGNQSGGGASDWSDLSNKPFETVGDGLSVSGGKLSADVTEADLADYATEAALTAHTSDTTIHITNAEREKWNAAAASKTWKFKDTAPATLTDISETITFTSNGTTYTSMSASTNPSGGVAYVLFYDAYEAAGVEVSGGTYWEWENEAYKTVKFSTAPSGTFLEWLEQNADPQEDVIPTKTSQLTNDSGYITGIPTASATTLGGVKVGDGLAINDGVLSATGGGSGGTDVGLGMTSATVGQIAKITAVDSAGKPTAWDPVDLPSGGGGETWEQVLDNSLENADINEFTFTSPYKKLWIKLITIDSAADTYSVGTGKVYHELLMLVGGSWKAIRLDETKIGTLAHTWGAQSFYYLDGDLCMGICTAPGLAPQTMSASMGWGGGILSTQYTGGDISGVRVTTTVVTEGTENTTSGRIWVMGVKA